MDHKEYLHESARTAAGHYHEELVATPHLDFMLQACIQASQWADKIKRALFYGKALPPQRSFSTTSLQHRPEHADLLHAALGVATEGGELMSHLRDVFGGATKLDVTNIREEIGDVLWYLALALRATGSDFEQVFESNIAKLRARFPDAFDAEAALDRDLDAERAVLEAHDEKPKLVVPELGSWWRHHNGTCYKVVDITNKLNTTAYPLSVTYRNLKGDRYSRFVSRWYSSMTLMTPNDVEKFLNSEKAAATETTNQ